MSTSSNPLSAQRLNPIIDELQTWAREKQQHLLKQFYASGYPPGTEPLPPEEQYLRLIQLRDAGHPDYWKNPKAQADLERLEKRFGAAPALRPQGGM